MTTHESQGDTFWDRIRAGANQAAKDTGSTLRYSAHPDATRQAVLIQNAIDSKVDTSALQAKLSQDKAIDWVITLGAAQALDTTKAIPAANSSAKVGTFDLNVDAAQAVQDGTLQFCIDQQPYLQGYVTRVLGDNVGGESILIKTISGLHPHNEGELLVDGRPVSFPSPRESLARGHRDGLPGPRGGQPDAGLAQLLPRLGDGLGQDAAGQHEDQGHEADR
jgi:ABC-type sugar transport system substrate-binding protein